MGQEIVALTNMYYVVTLVVGFLLGVSVASAKKLRKKKQDEQKQNS